MEIKYIESKEELAPVAEMLTKVPVLGFDTETTGYTTRVGDISLLQLAPTPEEVYVFNVLKLRDQGSDLAFVGDILASDQIVIMQNSKFDLQFLQKLLDRRLRVKNLTDTMLASMLLACGDKSVRHGLDKIAEREIGHAPDKSLQKSDFSGPDFSEAQIEYAAVDAALLHPIREKQGAKIRSEGLLQVARLEFDAVPTLAEMEYFGIYIEPETWTDRIRKQEEAYATLHTELLEDIGPNWPVQLLWGDPGINLASPQQVLELLHRLGVKAQATNEEELKKYEHKHPIIAKLLAFRELETALKKFGGKYNRFIDPATNRVHASFWQIEAPTGRMSSRDPNLMQVPKHGGYRDAFQSDTPGGKMITADYSQIELRIMAKMSGDKVLTEAFVKGEDLHNVTAHKVLGQPLESPDPEVRVIAKNLNFGTAYGAAPATFARLAKISEKQAAILLRDYWRVYHGLDRYLTQQGLIAANTGVMRTASGRKGRILFDARNPKLRGRAQRLGRNFSIQGTGADILKTALYVFREAVLAKGLDCYVVNCVHDEIVVEARSNAEEVAAVLESCMIEAAMKFLDPVPCKVDVRIADTWIK